MKIISTLTVIGVLLTGGIVRSGAQTTNTNAVLSVNISLTACEQGGDTNLTKVRITNRDILNASGVGNGRNTSLVLIFGPNFDTTAPHFFARVHQGRTNSDTDLSNAGVISVNESTSVSSEVTSSTGVTRKQTCALVTFSITTSNASFPLLQGVATFNQDNVGIGRGGLLFDTVPNPGRGGVPITVSGAGTADGNTAVAGGTISFGGRALEKHEEGD